MHKLMIAMVSTMFFGLAHAGAYEDILQAANNDDTATVVDLVQRGMDANTSDRSGTTLLMMASRNGNLALVKSLLAARANVNRRNQHGDTALLLAALKPQVEVAKLLIEHGADVNPPNWAPLHYAVLGGSQEMVALLVAKGAKLDLPAPNGQTALMLAVKADKLDLARLLVEAGANKDLAGPDGLTAIGLAKKEELLFTRDSPDPIALPENSPAQPSTRELNSQALWVVSTFIGRDRFWNVRMCFSCSIASFDQSLMARIVGTASNNCSRVSNG